MQFQVKVYVIILVEWFEKNKQHQFHGETDAACFFKSLH